MWHTGCDINLSTTGIDATKRHTGLVRGNIDLTKAYDKVNRGILWKILRLYEVPEELIVVIIAFRESAKAVLQINGELSATVIPLNRGLKQGSVLSPILFNIFFGVEETIFGEEVYIILNGRSDIRGQCAV